MSDAATSQPVKTESDADEKLQSKIVDYTTPSQGMEVDTDNDAHVKAKLRDDAGNPFGTVTNPVFTAPSSDLGDEVEDYNTSVDLAKDAETDHDYTVTGGKDFRGLRAFISAAGEFKYEIKKETAVASGTYTTLYAGFKQASNPWAEVNLGSAFSQIAGANVRITITNRDKTTDVYSTLVGFEI